jgi:hypothetical protein
MDLRVHHPRYHLRWWINGSIIWTNQPIAQSSQPCTTDRVRATHHTCACGTIPATRSFHPTLTRVPGPSRTSIELTRVNRVDRPHTPMSPCDWAISAFTQSFGYIVNHFSILVSHFAILNSVILPQWTQSFLLQCSIILWFCQPFWHSELNHFYHSAHISHFSTVLSYFVTLLANLLYWTQPFLLYCLAIFWLLQCSIIPHCYNAHHFSLV